MTTFNGASYVVEQIESILAQTRLPTELVICDDQSHDATVDLLTRALVGAPFRVEVVVNSKRLGVVANVEQAISRAHGDIIVLADHDDIWWRHKLDRLARRFEVDAELGAVFSDAIIIDQRSQTSGGRLWTRAGFSRRRQRQWQSDPVGVLLRGNVVTGATLAFRASLKSVVLPIPRLGWHDLWIAYFAATTSHIEAINEDLLGYRVHSANAAGLPGSIWEERKRRLGRPAEGFENLAQLRSLVERLDELELGLGPDLARLREKIQHQQFRSNLPTRAPARTASVFRAVSAGRYHHYSAGPMSAVFDLLYGGRLRS